MRNELFLIPFHTPSMHFLVLSNSVATYCWGLELQEYYFPPISRLRITPNTFSSIKEFQPFYYLHGLRSCSFGIMRYLTSLLISLAAASFATAYTFDRLDARYALADAEAEAEADALADAEADAWLDTVLEARAPDFPNRFYV